MIYGEIQPPLLKLLQIPSAIQANSGTINPHCNICGQGGMIQVSEDLLMRTRMKGLLETR